MQPSLSTRRDLRAHPLFGFGNEAARAEGTSVEEKSRLRGYVFFGALVMGVGFWTAVVLGLRTVLGSL